MRIDIRGIKNVVLAIAVIAVLSVMGMNCSRFDSTASSSGASAVGLGSGEEPMPVALLSSEQLLKAMISATGTEGLGELENPADDLIRQTYEERSGSLPSGQDLKLATGPTLVSITNLASAVCAKAVDRDRSSGESQGQDRLFFREFDFSKGAEAQSDASVQLAASRLARNSWRRDPVEAETAAFVEFAAEFKAQAAAGSIDETRRLAISVCTAVLSSFDAITY
jgi:hypothetical protein